nr:MAG TPA: resistance protein [Caudoviricetes sp.]
MNLYEIDSAIMDCVDMETGEIIDMEALEDLQMERDQKIENIGCWIKNLLADAKALKEENDNLAARQKTAENKAASLKAYLSSYLNGEKFKTAKVAISYRKSDSVDIAEGAVIPEEYLKYSDPTPDKIGLKAALKAGEEFPGISIVTSSNIQIK